jgi:hypothetical protein
MNGYVCGYKGVKVEVNAETLRAAQLEAAKRLGALHTYDVWCVLAEKDGKQVTHTPDF